MNLKIARIVTGSLLVITGVIWIVWDIYAFLVSPEATISWQITEFSYYSPALPFIFGMLCDHFFIPEFKPSRLLKRNGK